MRALHRTRWLPIETSPLFSVRRVIESPIDRTARPFRSSWNVGGAVKRHGPLTLLQSRRETARVLFLSLRILLLVWFVCVSTPFAAAQSPSDDTKPKDETKK